MSRVSAESWVNVWQPERTRTNLLKVACCILLLLCLPFHVWVQFQGDFFCIVPNRVLIQEPVPFSTYWLNCLLATLVPNTEYGTGSLLPQIGELMRKWGSHYVCWHVMCCRRERREPDAPDEAKSKNEMCVQSSLASRTYRCLWRCEGDVKRWQKCWRP